MDKLAISKPFRPYCCIDSSYPQPSEISFFGSAVTISVAKAFFNRLSSLTEGPTTNTAITLSQIENFFLLRLETVPLIALAITLSYT